MLFAYVFRLLVNQRTNYTTTVNAITRVPRLCVFVCVFARSDECADAPLRNDTGPLALCLIVKDEGEYLLEWVEHYLSLGASRVYVFDQGSHPPLIPTIADLVQVGMPVANKLKTVLTEPKTCYTSMHLC